MRLRNGFFGWRAGRTIGVLLAVVAICCVAASSTAASEVINTIEVGEGPRGVSADGTHVWVANYEEGHEGTVSEIEASTGKVINTIKVGQEPSGVSSDGTHVWVTNWGENTVSEIEASTGKVIHTIKVGLPRGVSSDGTHVWVASDEADTVSEINASTGKVIKTIKVGALPWGVSSDGTHVWVTNVDEHTVSEIEASTGKVINTIEVGEDPYGVSSDGTHVWVANLEGTVSEIEASTGKVINTIKVGEEPHGGVSSDGTHVWVANWGEDTVSEIEASTGKVIDTIKVGNDPYGVSSDGTHAWVTNEFSKTVSEILIEAPTVATGSASEVTPTAATLHGTVDPDGVEVSECEFEYGTTEAYGHSEPCSPSPGSGKSPVAVSASLTKLTADTTYHYRISAKNVAGTSYSPDQTFTTLLTSVSASTENAKEPAKATDEELSATASGGTGTVTVGDYGSEIGGAALSKGTGDYVDVYRSAASSFTSIEVKDCELGGGRSLWWYDPASGWEPISEPPALYSEGPKPCITVTFTDSTRPDIAQLTGTRFGTRFGDAALVEEAGKCEPGKDANFTEGACATVAEKKGKPDHKGKYEWYADPVECFAMKHGFYSEGCKNRDESKGKGKGSFEAGSGDFESTGEAAKFEIKSVGTLECKKSTAKGEMTGPKTGWETVTYTGCVLASHGECASSGQTEGAITTDKLEVLIEEGTEVKPNKEVVPKAVVVEFFPFGGSEYQVYEPIMTFSCGDEEYTLKGDALGQSTRTFNAMSSTSESVFSPEVGIQELETVTQGKGDETTFTSSEKVKSTQAFEVNTDP
jgi:YVTN family beta-propeller protein